MSWSLTLTADRPIVERDLVRVLFDKDVSIFPERQAWGWGSVPGLGVDVRLPEGKSLTLCGAYYSAHLAEEAAKKVAVGLRRLGYDVRVGRLSE